MAGIDLRSSTPQSGAYLSTARMAAAPLSTIGLIGTSRTAQCGSVAGSDGLGNYLWDALGYINWTLINLRQRLTWTLNAGVGGNTTTQMLARFATDVMAVSPLPGWLHIEPGPNDAANAITAATTIANVTSMIQQAQQAGMRVSLQTIEPSSYWTTTGMRQAAQAVNTWIKKTAPTLFPGLVVADCASALTDPATGGPNVTYYRTEGDGGHVHLNNRGALRVGLVLAEALAPFVPDADPLTVDGALDPYNLLAASNPFGNGGSGSALPTGWTILFTDGTAYTGMQRVVPRQDVAGQWGEINPANVTKGVQVLWQNTAAGVDWTAATDSLYGYVEFETDDDFANVKNFYCTMEFFNGGTPLTTTNAITARSLDGILPETPRRGVFYLPPSPIPATTTKVQTKVYMATQSGAYSGTVRLARPTLKKVGT